MALEHEVPTHLEIEDKPFFGLTMPQFITLFVGLAVAAILYNYALAWLPLGVRLIISGLVGLVVLLSVFIKPGGLSLSEWLLERIQFYFGVHLAVFGLREMREEMELEAVTVYAQTQELTYNFRSTRND
ncbi:MAG TPA: PrgI family protein [Chloroflexia bacterium]|nr:PrgI family protein [Chloroflexia bacterium]